MGSAEADGRGEPYAWRRRMRMLGALGSRASPYTATERASAATGMIAERLSECLASGQVSRVCVLPLESPRCQVDPGLRGCGGAKPATTAQARARRALARGPRAHRCRTASAAHRRRPARGAPGPRRRPRGSVRATLPQEIRRPEWRDSGRQRVAERLDVVAIRPQIELRARASRSPSADLPRCLGNELSEVPPPDSGSMLPRARYPLPSTARFVDRSEAAAPPTVVVEARLFGIAVARGVEPARLDGFRLEALESGDLTLTVCLGDGTRLERTADGFRAIVAPLTSARWRCPRSSRQTSTTSAGLSSSAERCSRPSRSTITSDRAASSFAGPASARFASSAYESKKRASACPTSSCTGGYSLPTRSFTKSSASSRALH